MNLNFVISLLRAAASIERDFQISQKLKNNFGKLPKTSITESQKTGNALAMLPELCGPLLEKPMTELVNDHLVLVGGKSAAGKSASLMGLENPEGVLYLNFESGKKLPFRAKFKQFTITDPYQAYALMDDVAKKPDKCHTIVFDSLTYMMDMMESVHVLTATDTQKAWGAYQQFFKNLMQTYVAKAPQNVIFTAHTVDEYNGKEMAIDTKVPVKGALKNNGIESYFSCSIAAKKMRLKELEGYSSDLLTITPEEEALGYKYVFQTRLTKDTVNERIRGPMGLFDVSETFIDNNMQLVMNRLREYYA